MAGGGMGAPAPTSTVQAPVQQAPVGAPPPAEPTGLQFGTAGVGTGIVQAATPAPQAQMQQSVYRQQMQPQQMSGLQAALMQMLGRYNQPMMRPQMQAMPQYQNPALVYRPNMAPAQAALRRTATTQAEAQAAAAAKAVEAEDAADFLRWQRQMYEAQKLARDNPYSGGGN